MGSEAEARQLLSSGNQRCVAYKVDARGELLFRRTKLDRVGVALASLALLASVGCIGFLDLEIEIESAEPEIGEEPWVIVPSQEAEEPAPLEEGPRPFALPEPEPEAEKEEKVQYLGWI